MIAIAAANRGILYCPKSVLSAQYQDVNTAIADFFLQNIFVPLTITILFPFFEAVTRGVGCVHLSL